MKPPAKPNVTLEESQEAATRELLRRRAEALRAVPPEVGDEDQLVWSAVCPVGDVSFAFLLSALKGILPLGVVTPVPLAGPNVVGVTRFQGRLVTVLSLASLLGGRAWDTDPTNLLVLEKGDGLIGVDCTDVPRTVPLEAGALDVLMATQTPFVAVKTASGDEIQLIDVARLVGDVGRTAAGNVTPFGKGLPRGNG